MIVMVVALFLFAFETSLTSSQCSSNSGYFSLLQNKGGGNEKWRSVYLVGLSHSSTPTAQTPI